MRCGIPVIPAKAGTSDRAPETSRPEVPAFAGMTGAHKLRSPLSLPAIAWQRISVGPSRGSADLLSDSWNRFVQPFAGMFGDITDQVLYLQICNSCTARST